MVISGRARPISTRCPSCSKRCSCQSSSTSTARPCFFFRAVLMAAVQDFCNYGPNFDSFFKHHEIPRHVLRIERNTYETSQHKYVINCKTERMQFSKIVWSGARVRILYISKTTAKCIHVCTCKHLLRYSRERALGSLTCLPAYHHGSNEDLWGHDIDRQVTTRY